MQTTYNRPDPVTLLAIGIWLVLSAPLSAEQGGVLTPGSRVRLLWAGAPGRLTGAVQMTDEKVLWIVTDDREVVRVPREQVTRLEMAWGRRGHAKKGFVTGALAGALMGGLLMVGSSEPLFCFGVGCGPPTTREKLAFVGFTTLASGGIGAGIGAFIRSDRWLQVPLGRVRVSAGPAGATGVGVSASLAF